jgi:spermidine/putrescine transport system substrate-binding protein
MIIKTILTSAILALTINVAYAGGKLSLYHWFEYIPEELLQKFESETGIEVTMDTYDSNESLLAA